jgi:phenylacetate-CoA ligase
MKVLNFILNIVFHILPAGILDHYLNRSLPNTAKAFKRFSRLDPALFEYISGKKVLFMFRRAYQLIPAYKKFLDRNNVDPLRIKRIEDFNNFIPQTTKENYISLYPLHERCINGRYPDKGYLEESAGTSGSSTFWIRSQAEELNNSSLMRATMKHLYGSGCDKKLVVLNAMALGGWSGGLRFASRVGSLGIVKNTGPDPQKIIRSLKELGTEFTYLLGGYPPFIVELIEFGKKINNFSWKDYTINIFPGGEGFVEEWRDYVSSQLKEGALIFSDYGAIDLDVGISVETPFTIAIRKLIQSDKKLKSAIFSSQRLPCFIGQFSNQQFYIREIISKSGIKELEITVMNLKSVSPNIKYVIGDEGGVIRFQDICKTLEENGYSLAKLTREFNLSAVVPFPIVYLYGRSDGIVTINGALISPSEINEAVLSDQELISSINTFKMSVESDIDNYIKLFVFLETRKDVIITESLITKSNNLITAKLVESNECFRNSFRKNPEIFKPVIKIIPFRTGLFSEKEGSVKQNYFMDAKDE